ncbi:MAG: M48 family metalloprotease [Betaproteobacteria bacterium]|nr:M48 family metalloprotease [Betaproteobacteria bacterium]
MKLENRLPAEGTNASQEHPLKEFAWLAGGAIAVVVALVMVVSYCAQWIAPRIPFKYELELARGIELAPTPSSENARAVQAELQALADRLVARMELPRGMSVRIGYHESGVVNAFATLGGQAVFYRGLLGKLESEDALAAVMAHELAHIKHRHPAAALGRGVAVGLMLSVVSAQLGRTVGGNVLSQAGMMTLLTFNRDQERQADEEALRVIAAEYGHVGGALELFEAFMRLPPAGAFADKSIPEFLRTHPVTAARLQAARDWASENGKALDGPRRALPQAIAAAATRKPKRPAQTERPAQAEAPCANRAPCAIARRNADRLRTAAIAADARLRDPRWKDRRAAKRLQRPLE